MTLPRHDISPLKKSSGKIFRKGAAQFSGQALGLVLALLVSHLIARRLGIGAEADAFLLGRRLITAVTETAYQIVGIVFIPMIALQVASGTPVWRILRKTAGPALLFGAALAAILALAAPTIVDVVAPDFAGPAKDLSIQVIVILVLAIPAALLTTTLSSYCNVLGLFGRPAALRQAPRAAVALALLFAASGSVALTASWAYTGASIVVALFLFVLVMRLGGQTTEPPVAPDQPAKGATFRRSAVALILAFSALIFLWIETSFAASVKSGGVATLDYGQRLGALLGNTLASALALVVFADLSKRIISDPETDLGTVFQRSLVSGLALILPITIGVAYNAHALVDLVLGYGALQNVELRTEIVTLVQLMAIAPLSALVLRMVLVRIVVEERLPIVRLISAAMAIELVCRVALFQMLTTHIGLPGIAWTLIIVPAVPVTVLVLWLHRQGTFVAHQPVIRPVHHMLATSVLTCIALGLGARAGSWMASDLAPKAASAVQILGSGICGGLVLCIAVIGFKLRPNLG